MNRSGLKSRSWKLSSALALFDDEKSTSKLLNYEEGESSNASFPAASSNNRFWHRVSKVILTDRRVFIVSWSVHELWYEDIIEVEIGWSWNILAELLPHKLITIRYRDEKGERSVRLFCLSSYYGRFKYSMNDKTEELFGQLSKRVKRLNKI